jgi:hypothetical protein
MLGGMPAAVSRSLQLVATLMDPFSVRSKSLRRLFWRADLGALSALIVTVLTLSFHATVAEPQAQTHANPRSGSQFDPRSLEALFRADDLVVLADTKHGVRERIEFFSSPELFAAMAKSGVRQVAIEMPRALGLQAATIETAADVEAFAKDVVRFGGWHFTNPDDTGEDSDAMQFRVAAALGRQVLLAKRYGLGTILYDFNNPLGGFKTFADPVYRCLAQLDAITWVKYGLDNKVTKDQRDAAMMRERLDHDDELAAYIADEVNAKGGGKLVVISGYAHAAVPGGLAKRLEERLHRNATVVAIFKDAAEQDTFHTFLWEQSRLLSIDLSHAPQFNFSIAHKLLRRDTQPGRYAALDGSRDRNIPAVCFQLALTR